MDDPFATIAAERRSLADLLDTLTSAQWATPSLCGAWTVKDVAAHLTGGATATLREFAGAMLKARGSFEKANVIMVAGQARLSSAEVTALLRANADDRFTPPTMDWHAPLTDLRVHTQDIVVPLGLDAGVPPGPWGDVLDFLVSPKARRGFVRRGRPELGLHATDLGWRSGSGPEVSGPASALALALSGRAAGLADLVGPGRESLATWVG